MGLGVLRTYEQKRSHKRLIRLCRGCSSEERSLSSRLGVGANGVHWPRAHRLSSLGHLGVGSFLGLICGMDGQAAVVRFGEDAANIPWIAIPFLSETYMKVMISSGSMLL